MKTRVVKLENLAQAKREISAVGSHQIAVDLMAPKAVNRALKIAGLRPVAANIIKQQMLSIGGEVATAHGALDQSIDFTDLLIFGTLKQLTLLIEKLKLQQFGLPEISEEIANALNNYDRTLAPLSLGKVTLDPEHSRGGRRTYIMGILNVTPDSFSDGGKFGEVEAALAHAKQMVAFGADIIDVGGESTRPGANPVSVLEEKRRVLPVISKLAQQIDVPISIDTTKAAVAKAALLAGASMVNDISGLRFDPAMAGVVGSHNAALCIMHIKGNPQDIKEKPTYSDLMGEIINYLREGLEIAKKAGILQEKIIVDPGIGFGKTVEHNLEILNKLEELKVLGCPILVGPSRKSVIGNVLDLSSDQRLEGTAAAVAIAIANGANLVRVHDVAQMARVCCMTDAITRRT